jgi:hypothetical protein
MLTGLTWGASTAPPDDLVVRGCAIALHSHVEAVHLSDISHLPANPLPLFELEDYSDELQPSHLSLALLESLFEKAYVTLQLDSEVLIAAVILLERLMRAVGQEHGPLRLSTMRLLVATSFVIAAKFYTDEPANLFVVREHLLEGLASAATLAECEVEFCTLIHFKMAIAPAQFAKYAAGLVEIIEWHTTSGSDCAHDILPLMEACSNDSISCL